MKKKIFGENNFSRIQFVYFSFNYIVGFGFVSTIATIIKSGSWSLLSFTFASFISFAVMLVYARAAEKYNNATGGIYGYAKLLKNRHWSFINGWNQLSQTILFSATSPLYIANLISQIDKEHAFIYQVLSLVIFSLITLAGTFGLGLMKEIVFLFSIFKWVVIIGGILLVFYLSIFTDQNFSQNFMGSGAKITANTVIVNTLFFIYAYEGIGQLTGVTKDVVDSKFKRMITICFLVIFFFYFICYIIFLGLSNIHSLEGLNTIWKRVFNNPGWWVFFVGIFCNRISAQTSNVLVYSRLIAPMAEDSYIPVFFARKNRHGEYRNAMWLMTCTSIFSMFLFYTIPRTLNLSSEFDEILETGVLVYLVNYLGIFITFLWMHYKSKTIFLSVWEIIIYCISIILVTSSFFISLIPPIVGGIWETKNTIRFFSYFGTIAFGYLIWYLTSLYQSRIIRKYFQKNQFFTTQKEHFKVVENRKAYLVSKVYKTK